MNIRTTLTWTLLLSGLCAVVAFSTACEGDSAEGIVRNVGLIVEGYYTHPNEGSMLVSDTSGADITSMNLRQSGDQLEGIDNNNFVFRGTIGQVVDNSSASFTLNGKSTSGANATISGTIAVSGTQATMSGTWIEDSLYGTVYGQATVPTNAPPSSGTTLTIDPARATPGIGASQAFRAFGGEAPYAWSVSNGSIGRVSPTSGQATTYTAQAAGTTEVVLTDSEGTRVTADIVTSPSGSGTSGPSTP